MGEQQQRSIAVPTGSWQASAGQHKPADSLGLLEIRLRLPSRGPTRAADIVGLSQRLTSTSTLSREREEQLLCAPPRQGPGKSSSIALQLAHISPYLVPLSYLIGTNALGGCVP